jgi:hypothetical protein
MEHITKRNDEIIGKSNKKEVSRKIYEEYV